MDIYIKRVIQATQIINKPTTKNGQLPAVSPLTAAFFTTAYSPPPRTALTPIRSHTSNWQQ
jgi:hypothetical protein